MYRVHSCIKHTHTQARHTNTYTLHAFIPRGRHRCCTRHGNELKDVVRDRCNNTLQNIAIHCTIFHHTAPHCTTLYPHCASSTSSLRKPHPKPHCHKRSNAQPQHAHWHPLTHRCRCRTSRCPWYGSWLPRACRSCGCRIFTRSCRRILICHRSCMRCLALDCRRTIAITHQFPFCRQPPALIFFLFIPLLLTARCPPLASCCIILTQHPPFRCRCRTFGAISRHFTCNLLTCRTGDWWHCGGSRPLGLALAFLNQKRRLL
mmetsp:Transcript_28978/g.24334  ORF Transcript_28978/g.24334 Transcript_28978/m.24334 type:complete len:261 (+) Transcript_28978:124-906(+)